jgi:hypothetical protein
MAVRQMLSFRYCPAPSIATEADSKQADNISEQRRKLFCLRSLPICEPDWPVAYRML